jgi:hypothetical protein
MKFTHKSLIGAALVASTLVGGGIGAAVFGPNGASAQSTSSSTTVPTQSSTAPGYGMQPNGKFVPNEDPTHEKGESAQREAQEDAGQMPTVP